MAGCSEPAGPVCQSSFQRCKYVCRHRGRKDICRYCEEEQNLCKSHIIPKAFYPQSNKRKCVTVYGDKLYTKRVQSGLYEYLLCEKAEKIFGIYEQHAKKILISNIDKYSKLMQQIIIIPKDEYNYEYLKKFFISIIWRMSVSKIEHFENINLGKYENIALKILKNEIPMNENFFVVMIFL